MRIDGAVALVTGANRGLGLVLTEELLRRGAAKVYAGARNPDAVPATDAVPLQIDITDQASVAAAAEAAADVTLLVNNAGNFTPTALLDGPMDEIRALMETHFFGTLQVTRAFAPHLSANAPAAVLNIVSVLSWFHPSGGGAYAAAKSALWAQSDSLREDSRRRGST